jgi:hypothetical protein
MAGCVSGQARLVSSTYNRSTTTHPQVNHLIPRCYLDGLRPASYSLKQHRCRVYKTTSRFELSVQSCWCCLTIHAFPNRQRKTAPLGWRFLYYSRQLHLVPIATPRQAPCFVNTNQTNHLLLRHQPPDEILTIRGNKLVWAVAGAGAPFLAKLPGSTGQKSKVPVQLCRSTMDSDSCHGTSSSQRYRCAILDLRTLHQ